jgi:hypothetical protein
MKKTLLFLSLMLSMEFTIAQEKTEYQKQISNIEKFISEPNIIIKQEYNEIGEVDNIHYQINKVVDLITNKSLTGLRIEGYNQTNMARANPVCFLDKDEVAAFEKYLEYITANVICKNLPINGISYFYSARGGFRSGIFMHDGNLLSYINFGDYIEANNFNIKILDLPKIKEVIAKVLTQL